MRIFMAAAVLFCLGILAPPASAGPRIQSERFNDWYYRCVTPEARKGRPHPKTQCEAVQIAQTRKGKQTVNLLTISVSEAVHGKKKNAVLTVLAPQNVHLPSGLGLSIGEKSKVTLHYRNCNNAGCWIQHVIDHKSLEALKSNEAAFANMRLINGKRLNIKLSLKGFAKALKALESGEHRKKKS
jgi:invasion protein IalB